VVLAASADVNVELPVDGLARDLDLELLTDAGLAEGAGHAKQIQPKIIAAIGRLHISQ
jgi:hypothetical protein